MAKYPEVFWLFILLIPVLIVFIRRYFCGMGAVLKAGGEWRYRTFRESFMVKWFFSSVGFSIFLAAVILSLAGFPGPYRKVPFKPSGYDVIYVADISRSMLAADTFPSRLDKTGLIIRSLSDGLEADRPGSGNRYGLVVFRGTGSRILPLTEDRGGLYGVLNILDPDIMSSPGTNIASGLNAAIDSFVSGSETSRHIILFTDGEALEGNTDEVLGRIRQENIKFTVVGMGNEDGTVIPLEGGERVTNSAGRDVITRLYPEILEELAGQGGGTYLHCEDSRLLETILAGFEIPGIRDGGGFVEEETEKFRFYLLIALAGLALYQAAGIIRWKGDR